MKKIAIAGASLALAALPVVSTFAADTRSHTDTLNLTVDKVCTLGTISSAGVADDKADATTHHTSGYTGSWTDGATSTTSGVGRTDTLAANVSVGQRYDGQADSTALGTTTFTIRCNDSAGYTLSAAAQAANSGTAGNLTDAAGHIIPTGVFGNETNLTADNNSYWNFFVSNVSNAYVAGTNTTGQQITEGYDSNHTVPTTATSIVRGNGFISTGATQETITVTYGAGIDAYQEAGTYAGSVQYTLAVLGS